MSNRDWLEDLPHENGNYQHICVMCKEIFYGDKHRYVCKRCTDLQGWIPIDERKPSDCEMVVFITSNDKLMVMKECSDWHITKYSIKYWMELPKTLKP